MHSSVFRRLPDLALLLVVALTVAFFFLAHEGLYDLDDYLYAGYAHQLASGTFHVRSDPLGLLHDPLKERPLIFAPVALLYQLFGTDIITTTLWPLACTLGCAVVIWALYRRREPVVAAGAMLLLNLHYFTLDLTRYLYPDNILMFWCLCSAAALLTGRRPTQAPRLWGVGFALLNFAAFLSKETIVYYLPFYLGLLVFDLWKRQHRQFWVAALGTGILLITLYLSYYQIFTNDAFYRVHLIEHTNAYLKEGNFLQGHQDKLLARVTYLPVLFFVGIGLGAALVLAVSVVFNREPVPDSDASFWMALGFSTLAFFWLGSTSLSQYNPITLLPRMTTPVLPPLCLAAGFGLRNFVRTGRGGWLLGASLLACAAWLHNSVSVVYAGLGFYFVATALGNQLSSVPRRLRPGTTAFATLTLLALAGCLAIRPLYFMGKPSISSHFDQNQIFRKHLQAPAQGVVFVDDYLISNYDFYYGFQVPQGLSFRRYWARDSVRLAPGQRAWLLLNRSTLTNDELTRKLIRYSADSVLRWFPQRRPVAETGKVTLYEVFINK
ncbi:ArnT family glycosyltransferase [Hymenobacter jejuensis]|uniref:ArnT family glycosyltransferase n=1 Tax=Hymenobacter jejuensis TaxID=2502781 RepID=UPI0013FCF6FB|nr:glycosyltransferase family 39 protein [Hymenobacter jejuensis]